MVVTITITIIILLSLLIPLKYIKKYYIVAAVGLSSLYLFVSPTESDLTRLYGVVDAIKNVSIWEIIFMVEKNYGNNLLNSYIPHYPVFCLYAKIVSIIPKQFFVFFPALAIYLIPIKIFYTETTYRNNSKWVYVFSYSAFLMMTDFLSISAIRNIGVAMFFCFILYYELSGKGKKVLCYSGYLLLCFIHSYAVFLIMIRLLILISNRYTKFILAIGVSVGYAFLVSGNDAITELINRVDILSYAFGRLNDYNDYNGTLVTSRRYFMLAIYILILIVSFLANQYLTKTHKNDKYLVSIYDYMLFSAIFTIGSFTQYDIFIRGSFIIFPVWILFSNFYMGAIGGKRFGTIICTNKENTTIKIIIYFGTIMIILLTFIYLANAGYDWMDAWFTA